MTDQLGNESNEKPAVSRARTTKTALDRFEDILGGRDNVIDTLHLSSLDKKQQHFLRLLCDPTRSRDSLVTIARDSGLTPLGVLSMLRDAHAARGTALALGQLAESLPAVIKDVAEKAVDSKVECPRCFGEKYEREGVECVLCLGKGEVFRGADLDRQKLVLDATGVTKRGTGVAVQVNTQVNNNSMPANAFSKFAKTSDDIAYDVGEVIDTKAEDVT